MYMIIIIWYQMSKKKYYKIVSKFLKKKYKKVIFPQIMYLINVYLITTINTGNRINDSSKIFIIHIIINITLSVIFGIFFSLINNIIKKILKIIDKKLYQ